jgi:hypothetical protein
MGWTPEVALAMDVAMIELALESRSDLLATIFGSGTKDKGKGKAKGGKVTPAKFKAFRDRINGVNRKRDG